MTGQASEITSLILIFLSLIVLAYLAYRVRTVRSLQFGLFVMVLIIFIAEVPRILETIGLIRIGNMEPLGLLLHTVSMVFIVAFITLRVFRYFKG